MRYIKLNLKQWDVEGYKHTEENINMYLMFADLKQQLQDKGIKPKKFTKKKGSIKIKKEGNVAYKVYEDKVNMGDPNSDMIPYIRDYLDKEKQSKK